MIFKDVLEFYEELDNTMLKLEPIIKDVSILKTTMMNSLLSTSHILMGYISNDPSNRQSDFTNLVENSKKLVTNYLDIKFKKIDLYFLGKLHHQTLALNSDFEFLNEDIIFISKEIDSFSNFVYSIISDPLDPLSLSLDRLKSIYYALDRFELNLTTLKNKIGFVRNLELPLNEVNFEYKEENILELRFYEHYYDIESLNKNLSSINDIYDKLSMMISLEENSSPIEGLIPIKVETGSLFGKFAGDPFVLKGMEVIFECTFSYCIARLANTTFKSVPKKEKKVDLVNSLKEILDIKAKFSELGIEVTGDEETIETLYSQVLVKVLDVVTENPKIKINSKVFDFKNDTSNTKNLNQILQIDCDSTENSPSEDTRSDDADLE